MCYPLSQNITNTITTRTHTVDNDDRIKTACELFEKYAALLNQEFHDHLDAEKVGCECIAIATQLLKLGFVILANVSHNMKIIILSDDKTQVIITLTYGLILVSNEISIQNIQEPVAFAEAVAKIFGPVTTQIYPDRTHPIISSKDEVWLHSILDDLGADKNLPTEERN